MSTGSAFSRPGLLCAALLLVAVAIVSTACHGSRGFPANGKIRLRVINESRDLVTDITITHGESFYVASLAPGSRTSTMMSIDEDEDITISYFHPQVGAERQTYALRAREQDAGYIEVRFDREGQLDVRSRYQLTESH
jgi:hypothetical protein